MLNVQQAGIKIKLTVFECTRHVRKNCSLLHLDQDFVKD